MTTETNEERLVYNVEEVQRLLSLSRATTYSLCNAGVIPTIRLGKRLLVPRHRLLEMLQGKGLAQN
jgi:excisionase family DNA binding protein